MRALVLGALLLLDPGPEAGARKGHHRHASGRAAAADPGATYPVRLSRPARVGEKAEVRIQATRRQVSTLRIGPQVARTDTQVTRAEIEALRTVVEVGEGGRPVKLEYKIKRSLVRGPGGKRALLQPGQVLGVDYTDDSGPFRLRDKPVPAALAQDLGLLFGTHAVSLLDDDAFGTKDAQPIGGEWEPRTARIAAGLKDVLPLRPEDLDGTVRLLGLRRQDGVECLEVRSRLSAANFPYDRLPPGAELDSTALEASFWGLYPKDPARPVAHEGSDISITVKAWLTVGAQKQLLEVRTEQTQRSGYSPAE